MIISTQSVYISLCVLLVRSFSMIVHFRHSIFLTLFALLVSVNVALVSQTTWEFDGTPYEYQKAHFDSATKAVQVKLGIQMRTFGAPYNQIDTTLIRVMSEDTSYKVLLLGQNNPPASTGIINLTKRVMIESETGVPSYSTFISDYNAKKATYTEYIVMQGHPYAWTTASKLNEFKNIVEFLISEGVKFVTPYEYYQYVTDLSIPRTNKVHVLLKLDDLRATAKYFEPCFPTFDYLVSKGVKAGFGVNFMWGLTAQQADTLHYYIDQTDSSGLPLFEIWNHGLDHSMSSSPTVGGNWSSTTTWPNNILPSEDDDVIVPSGSTIIIDIDSAVCRNLTIHGTLSASNAKPTMLTVNGNVLIHSGATFNSPSNSGGSGNIFHSLIVYGNFTNSGGVFDFRMGSNGSSLRGMNTTFAGSTNSTITVGTFSSSNNDFNGITVNKTGGAKVICGSDVFLDQGATAGSSQLVFINGMIETGNKSINVLSLNSADIIGASPTSYVNGALGRGMSNSSPSTKYFPVGDINGYRPISVSSTTSGVASTHYVRVRVKQGDANSGSNTYTNGIQEVSHVRYYEIEYNKGVGSGAASMSFNKVQPSYGTDDGVTAGSTDLRVAYSVDGRLTWNGINQTIGHVTSLTSPPTTITPDTLPAPITLSSGSGLLHVAIAKTNTLSVSKNDIAVPHILALLNNYPNPFNPTTNINFTVPFEGRATVRVFDLLGKEIATVFNDVAVSGKQYSVPLSAAALPSGIYFSQLEFGGQKLVKKMLLMK